MKRNNFIIVLVLLIAGFVVVSCDTTTLEPQLTLENMTKDIPSEGGSVVLTFTCNGAWSVDTTGFKWLKLSRTSGIAGNDTINLTAIANSSGVSRSVLLNVISENGQARRVTAHQAPIIFASYNTSPIAPDATGMGSTAMQLNANIKMGINIWNTMEVPGGETGWGNPLITQNLIHVLKGAGFNAIRIPCGYWAQGHMNKTTGEIDATWLNRIKEVVQYCVNDGMYVEINRHHDGNDDFHLTGAKLDSAKAIHKAIWEQVATKLRDFDEHVMFASYNEPVANDLPTATVLHDCHQIFIDAVRSTGGKNAYRTLVLQAPSTSLDLMNYFAPGGIPGMPVDKVPDKLMLEFHWYAPVNFCILKGGDASYAKEWRYWGANFHSTTDPLHNSVAGSEEDYVEKSMQWAKKNYVDKGIPVFIGEFGAENHAAPYTEWDDVLKVNVYHPQLLGHPADSILSLRSKAHFFRVIAQKARENKVSTFLWAGIIDRGKETIGDQRDLDSLRAGAGY
ncbi:MAG: cellulase family glycosylhydrolase [Paludibacter sp.]|nr:cellulase family glycosylhydrolase [Paludibacter sp.]